MSGVESDTSVLIISSSHPTPVLREEKYKSIADDNDKMNPIII
jgi:hypothetical protein